MSQNKEFINYQNHFHGFLVLVAQLVGHTDSVNALKIHFFTDRWTE